MAIISLRISRGLVRCHMEEEEESCLEVLTFFLLVISAGARTRYIGEAHVEYFRGLKNPLGIKVGPDHKLSDLCHLLNLIFKEPTRAPVVLITRFGASSVGPCLSRLIDEIRKLNYEDKVIWMCDPMHGNTFTDSTSGLKRRSFETAWSEFETTVRIHKELGSELSGIHLEATPEDVEECIEGDIVHNTGNEYASKCDPRFNRSQTTKFIRKAIQLI